MTVGIIYFPLCVLIVYRVFVVDLRTPFLCLSVFLYPPLPLYTSIVRIWRDLESSRGLGDIK